MYGFCAKDSNGKPEERWICVKAGFAADSLTPTETSHWSYRREWLVEGGDAPYFGSASVTLLIFINILKAIDLKFNLLAQIVENFVENYEKAFVKVLLFRL